MDPIREAFQRIKQDIFDLQEQLLELKQDISHIKDSLNVQKTPLVPTHIPTQTPFQTDNSNTYPDNQTHIQTDNYALEPLKHQDLAFSTGNDGVPTDRQTNQQTDRHMLESTYNQLKNPKKNSIDDFERANKILESLDDIKKEIRRKFKRLTPQEMAVFSSLYALEEQNFEEITYKHIANNLNLTESSIRDYINKLIKKGVPIVKTRQNNKIITLSISKDLKNITNLSTINQLRDL